MRAMYRYTDRHVQTLLNAVVMQAAEDYRMYSAKLLKRPGSKQAAEEKEMIRSFFLSQYFEMYTTAEGAYILKKLESEEQEMQQNYEKRNHISLCLCEIWEKIRLGDGPDPDQLQEAQNLAKQLKSFEKEVPDVWQNLFRLTTKEKEIIRMLKKWEKEYGGS
ncbi:MAG: hypothetical protein IJ237_05355 [Oscillospiraceae bacterium]|nr:hypothetical protein [Oscillospiraceae bacterium]